MRTLARQRGVSLIEVLMAVLIFSVGLIGLAGLLVMASRSNQAAYLRTQVTFLAGNMADRMRANPVGLWNGAYDGAVKTGGTAKACDAGAACTPAEIAARDRAAWATMLATALPDPQATISCDKGSAGFTLSADQVNMRPPFGGSCSMTVSWTERRAGDKAHSDGAKQTFAWVFQP
jgi:type IV pilus assembly protein PilV